MECGICAGLSRRAFLEATLAALGTAGIAACAPGGFTAPGLTRFTVNLSSFPVLAAVGGVAVVDSGSQSGEPVAVARTGTNTFVALSLICPHRGTTVSVIGNSSFFCPGHGATFAASGAWTGGQQTSNLATYPLSYDPVLGTLQIG